MAINTSFLSYNPSKLLVKILLKLKSSSGVVSVLFSFMFTYAYCVAADCELASSSAVSPTSEPARGD